MAERRSSTGASRSPRRSGGGGGCTGSGGRRRPTRDELERLCGSPDHQGVVAEVDPYPYADPRGLLDGKTRWSSPSTRSRTRATSAPSAARPSSPAPPAWSIPERRAAAVTAAACKASAGAVEHLRLAHVRNLADWLAEAKDAGFWIWGADAEAKSLAWEVDLDRPHRPRPRRRGQGPPPAGRRMPATVSSRCRSVARSSSLNVSAAAAALLFEAMRQRTGSKRLRCSMQRRLHVRKLGVDRTPRARKLRAQ